MTAAWASIELTEEELASAEHCRRCGQPYWPVIWSADPELWARVVKDRFALLCPPCFTRLAWDEQIPLLWRPIIDEPSTTCPQCGRTSHNPNDIAHGYCGSCHWWTMDPQGVLNQPWVIAQAKLEGVFGVPKDFT